MGIVKGLMKWFISSIIRVLPKRIQIWVMRKIYKYVCKLVDGMLESKRELADIDEICKWAEQKAKLIIVFGEYFKKVGA